MRPFRKYTGFLLLAFATSMAQTELPQETVGCLQRTWPHPLPFRKSDPYLFIIRGYTIIIPWIIEYYSGWWFGTFFILSMYWE